MERWFRINWHDVYLPSRWDYISNLLILLQTNFFLFKVFKLGHHQWFALWRLITNSGNAAFTGGVWNRFLTETAQVEGRTKNLIMKRIQHETMWLPTWPINPKMTNRRMKLQEPQLPLYVAQHCSLFIFPLQKFLCWIFRNFLLRNKTLVFLT